MLLQLVSFLFLLTSACIPTSYCLITGNSLLHARLESHGLGKLHAVAKKNDSKIKQTNTEAVVIPPNYNVALGFAASSAFISLGAGNIALGVPVGLIALLLFVQTGRVRFAFDDEALEVLVSKKSEEGATEALDRSRENFVVGGRNRWRYAAFEKWFFLPSREFPVLMYFKETQTSPQGQVHLFPVIMDGRLLYETMMQKIGPK